MRFAVIVHPDDINQARSAYPLLKRIPAGLLVRILPYLPPVKTGEITTQDGSVGDVITCPLLPVHFERLAQKYLWQKIITCLKKAEKQGAQAVGLEGLTAFFLDGGQIQVNPIKASLTTGQRLRTHVLLEGTRLAAKKQGIKWSQAEVVIAGAHGQEGETWITLLARESRILTLLQTVTGSDLGVANKIIYETGLALKVTVNPQLAFANADIVFLHQLDPQMSLECAWFKPGTLVCSIMPEKYWEDALMSCKSIVYIDKSRLVAPPGLAWSGYLDFSAGISPVLAETIIMTLEQNNECFYPGREITIRQVENMARLAHKHGFQLNT